MITIEGQYNDTDFKAAVQLHFRTRLIITVLWLAVAAASVLVVIASIPRSPTWISGIITSVVLVVTFLQRYVLAPRQTLSAFRKNKALSSRLKMEIDESYFSQDNDFGSGKLTWDLFTKWKADEKIALLYQSSSLIYIVPFRLIPSERDRQALKDILESKIKRNTAKSGRTKTFWIIILAVSIASFLFFYFVK